MSPQKRLSELEQQAAALSAGADGTPRNVLTIELVYRNPKTGPQPDNPRYEYAVWHDRNGTPTVVKKLVGGVSFADL